MAKAKKAASSRTNRKSAKFIARLPEGMREHLAEVAERHGRTMNAELVVALAMHFTNSTIERPVAPAQVPEMYKLLFEIGNTVDYLHKAVDEIKAAIKK